MLVVVGLGGNLGDPPTAFSAALRELDRRHPVVALSSLYRSPAEGPSQPDYLNAAAVVDADLSPRRMLAVLHRLEAAAGRDRGREVRWGPRPLDLDLLLAEHLVCRGPRLTLPHPRLDRRAFALAPAAEVAPSWVHPLRGVTLLDLVLAAGATLEPHPWPEERG